MRPDRLLLEDMLESIGEVMETMPAARAEFDGNKLIQSHVLRHIQIIGEAAWRLSKPLKERHAEVPWKSIAGMRHVIVHDYFAVDWNEVFATAARRDVPALKPLVEAMLKSDGIEGE